MSSLVRGGREAYRSGSVRGIVEGREDERAEWRRAWRQQQISTYTRARAYSFPSFTPSRDLRDCCCRRHHRLPSSPHYKS